MFMEDRNQDSRVYCQRFLRRLHSTRPPHTRLFIRCALCRNGDVKDGCDDRNNAKKCVTARTKKNDTNCDLRQLRLSGGWTTAPLVSPHIPDSDFPDRGQTQDLLQADLASSITEMRFFFLHLAKNVYLKGWENKTDLKGLIVT